MCQPVKCRWCPVVDRGPPMPVAAHKHPWLYAVVSASTCASADGTTLQPSVHVWWMSESPGFLVLTGCLLLWCC
jgi:hypothetical protein